MNYVLNKLFLLSVCFPLSLPRQQREEKRTELYFCVTKTEPLPSCIKHLTWSHLQTASSSLIPWFHLLKPAWPAQSSSTLSKQAQQPDWTLSSHNPADQNLTSPLSPWSVFSTWPSRPSAERLRSRWIHKPRGTCRSCSSTSPSSSSACFSFTSSFCWAAENSRAVRRESLARLYCGRGFGWDMGFTHTYRSHF